ncbi:MAG: molybdopterin-binding/glycosyltransferase family 2 protein [Acidiferrobacterales bacterium]|nr:molybdopterin-binding/glycosyltransferase family 2 protein [Acidiferrobacterales bacterium]
MKDCEGAILAHSIVVLKQKWKKGRQLSSHDVSVLAHEGFESVHAAKLEPNDVGEDAAAEAVARVLTGHGVEARKAVTGRCNLYATDRGLLRLRTERIQSLNAVDEAVTVATLDPHSRVFPGQLLASVKVMPYAVSRRLVDRCVSAVASGAPAVRVNLFQSLTVGLIQTRTDWFNPRLLEKGSRMLRERAEMVGLSIGIERICDHHEDQVSGMVQELLGENLDLILVLGATAIQDRRDVIPSAIVDAGGKIEHFGMPVDPGNLLLLAKSGRTRILGLPGCVRSPKRNGFDFVFERIVAGLDMDAEEIMAMGVGGILTEPSRRPERRTAATVGSRRGEQEIAAIVLAAGQSRRMGTENKLFLPLGSGSVIQQVVANLEGSTVSRIFVVTGHQHEEICKELSETSVTFVNNPEYSKGLSTSLRTALANLPPEISGVLVCLGDMPFVRSEHVNALVDSFDSVTERQICVPTFNGKRGNPVLWDRRYMQEMMEVRGDVGAKHMIGDYEENVTEVAFDDPGVVSDIDTPEVYAELIARSQELSADPEKDSSLETESG